MSKYPRWFRIALPLWLLGLGLVLQVAGNYQFTPGRSADAPTRWPRASTIPLDPERPTLVMTCHPKCPCTAASLAELEALEAHRPGQFSVNLLMLDGEGWANSGLWQTAQRHSWIHCFTDPGRRESKLFGSYTSGQVLLYGPAGELRFSGGITAGRGHEGDNPGLYKLTTALGGGPVGTTPVYGCSLVDPTPCACGGSR